MRALCIYVLCGALQQDLRLHYSLVVFVKKIDAASLKLCTKEARTYHKVFFPIDKLCCNLMKVSTIFFLRINIFVNTCLAYLMILHPSPTQSVRYTLAHNAVCSTSNIYIYI